MMRPLACLAFALAVGCNAPAIDKTVEKDPPATAEAPSEAKLTLDAKVLSEGGKHVYQLTASVNPPWVIKDTTPFAVTLLPSEGLTPAKQKLGKEDFVDKTALVKVVTTTLDATPGEHDVKADVEMYVCSSELCERKQMHVETRFAAADK